jgi:hypothetical protein
MPRYKSLREDGRTDIEVVYALVEDSVPNDEFPYEALIEVLQDGVDREITRKHVHFIISKVNVILLETRSRALQAVRNYGYRIVHASEQMSYAQRHERKAANQVTTALRLVKHTILNELSEEQRKSHQEYHLRLDAIDTSMSQLRRKQASTERIVKNLVEEKHADDTAMQMMVKDMIARLEKLENSGGTHNGN